MCQEDTYQADSMYACVYLCELGSIDNLTLEALEDKKKTRQRQLHALASCFGKVTTTGLAQ